MMLGIVGVSTNPMLGTDMGMKSSSTCKRSLQNSVDIEIMMIVRSADDDKWGHRQQHWGVHPKSTCEKESAGSQNRAEQERERER